MLQVLLTVAAAISCPDAPAALCPPCHPDEVAFTFGGFLLSLLKSFVSLAVIVYPLYKSFKAWESNRLKACRTMLAYWCAVTLLGAMKDVTDEVIGNWFNAWLHHIIVAAIKLAPIVLGPDLIYDYTVRPFFEHHEEEMDFVLLKANVKAQEVKADLQSALTAAQPYIDRVERAVSPSIEHMRESIVDATHSVEAALGMKIKDAEHKPEPRTHLSPEDAVRKDEELTLQSDPTSLTGLRQRSKLPNSSTSIAQLNGDVAVQDKAEIEKAKQRDVLVEKIVWGHGLSAKNDEYQRQLKEKTTVTTAFAQQISSNDSSPPRSPTLSGMQPPPVVASHPPLSAFPLPPAVKASSEDVTRTKVVKSGVVVTGQQTTLPNKTVLLDSNSIPQIAPMQQQGFAADQQKEL